MQREATERRKSVTAFVSNGGKRCFSCTVLTRLTYASLPGVGTTGLRSRGEVKFDEISRVVRDYGDFGAQLGNARVFSGQISPDYDNCMFLR